MIACANSGFSLFGGFVVFAVVGNLAWEENKPVSHVAAEGPGLAFVVFPKVGTQAGRSGEHEAVVIYARSLSSGKMIPVPQFFLKVVVSFVGEGVVGDG